MLLGRGPAEIDAVLSWESAWVASLLATEGDCAPEARRALAPFDTVVGYTSSDVLAHSLGTAGAHVVVHPPLPPPGGPHAARWLAEAVTGIAPGSAVTPPVLRSTPEEEAQARPCLEALGEGFLAVHPGSGSLRKNWPPERFAAIVDGVGAGRPWLLVEGPADAAPAQALARLPSVVHARSLPPRVLGAVLSRASLYVGNDSGVSHLAAAWGARVLALFGPTDPAQWAPVGPKVSTLRSADGTMAGLGLDAVLRAARESRADAGPATSDGFIPRPPSG